MSNSDSKKIRFLKQHSELFPEDFHIIGSPGDSVNSVQSVNREIPPYEPPSSGDLAAYESQICDCKRCPLGESRTKFVFGVGDPDADLMFVGEAPGHQEDMQGEPFVGPAGQLLDKILKAINLTRQQVYIGNVLKCRPPNNRDPNAEEIEACEPYLIQQIQMIQPKAIIALGRVAGNTLLKESMALKNMRGTTWNYHGTDLIVTYHPAALLRNEQLKRPTWEDFQMIQKKYLKE